MDHANADGDFSVIRAANMLLRNLRGVAAVVLLFVGAGAVLGLIAGTRYLAASSFFVRSDAGGAGRLAGFAAQFGLPIGNLGAGAPTIDFYEELLTSRVLLESVAKGTYTVASEDGTDQVGSLSTLLEIEGENDLEETASAVGALESWIRVDINSGAGIVQLVTEAPWPDLAVQINRALLDRMMEFEVSQRRSMATAEREFVEARRMVAAAELTRAEDSLTAFLRQNRTYNSPELAVEAERLQRQVNLKEQVLANLNEAYERARIDEVRSIPTVAIMDAPEAFVEAQSYVKKYTLTGAVLGILTGLLLMASREHWARRKILEPGQYGELQEHLERIPRFRRSSERRRVD